MHQGGTQIALLAPLGEVVDPMGGDPVERVAHHVEELRVGEHRVHALRHAQVLRIGRVVGRGLAADRGARSKWLRYQSTPRGQLRSAMKKLSSFGLDIGDLGMQAQVVVKAAGAALLRPDDDQIGQRTGSRAGASVGAAAASGRALVGVASGDAMVPAEDSIALGRVGKPRSPFAGRLCTPACALYGPSSAGARGGRGGRRCGIATRVGRRPRPHRERVTEARPARQDQPQAPAHELLVVAARELRLALAQAPARARRPRPGPPKLPDRERVGDHAAHAQTGSWRLRFSASHAIVGSVGAEGRAPPRACVGLGRVSVWSTRRGIVLRHLASRTNTQARAAAGTVGRIVAGFHRRAVDSPTLCAVDPSSRRVRASASSHRAASRAPLSGRSSSSRSPIARGGGQRPGARSSRGSSMRSS